MSPPPDTIDLGPFLVNRFGDRYLHAVNGNSFNRVGSQAVFRRHFGEALWAEDSLNVLVGSDSGLLLEHVLEHGPPSGSRFLFVEPAAVLEALLPRIEALDLGEAVAITDLEHWKDRLDAFSYDDYLYLGRLRVLRSLAAADAWLPDYQALFWEVYQATETMGWEIQARTGNRPFIERHLENLADNRVPAIHLKDAFRGHTAVLLGGGPSLPRLFPWIREHRDGVLLMAVSRVCRQLLAEGLSPDIVVSIDPHDLSFDVSRELLRLDPDVVFVHSYHVSPLLLGQWHGRSAYLGPRLPWKTGLNRPNLGLAGPTVTNSALNLAIDLGLSQVVLGGVDLCFSREGYTHAAGSNEQRTGPLLSGTGVKVETNDGAQAESRQDFASAIRTMGLQAGQARERGCRVINPIPEAARIPDVDHVPLADIRFEPTRQPARQAIAALLPADHAAARARDAKQVTAELTRIGGRLRRVRALALEALECNDGLFGRGGRSADFKYKLRMDKIERRLDREFGDITPTVRSFGDLRFLRLVRPDNKAWSDEDIERVGRDYYEAYRDSTDEVLTLVEAARERVASRAEEDRDAPDLDRLLARWEADRQPGRARRWRERHPEAATRLDPATVERLRDLDERFEAMLTQSDTGQMRWCRNEYSLTPVPGRARLLFQRRDANELRRLAEGLALVEAPRARDLELLVNGYLEELADRPEQALDAYQALIGRAGDALGDLSAEINDPVLEEALSRTATLSLGQDAADNALLALNCLAALSPVYEPSYADLLRLTGATAEAVGVYTDYLKKAPDDLATLLKLGKLYREMGAQDSARMAFRFVVQKDPADRAARALLAEMDAAG